ncbi:fimbrial protein, partial [Salmonella enterica]|nr:fimbrial protein [Salmonella enterica]
SDNGGGGSIHEELIDKGSPSSFIVTNMPGWAPSCEIDQPEQTVDLGTVLAKDIKSGPIESSLKAFEIGLKCSGTQTDYEPLIRLTTSASTGLETFGGEAISYMNNQYTGANSASNIGISLFYDLPTGRLPAFFNTPTNYPQEFDLSADANPRLKFLATFFKPAFVGDVIAGKFEADVTVEMFYP